MGPATTEAKLPSGRLPARPGGQVGQPRPTSRRTRLLVNRREAAEMLGMSLDSFERHVQTSLRLVRVGRMRLVPVSELERYVDGHAARLPAGL